MTAEYRPAIGIMLLNGGGKVFVAQRLDNAADAWQMPQGGLDEGEEAWPGALRELEEETGILPYMVERIAEAPADLTYDFPPELTAKLWKGRYRGQSQRWFLCRFTGRDADVNLETPHPEFRAWRWVDPAELPGLIVPFKRQLYRDILAAFETYL